MAKAMEFLNPISLLSKLFGGSKTPELPPVKTAPVTDDKQAKAVQQRQMMRQYAGTGRQGTALSEGSKLG